MDIDEKKKEFLRKFYRDKFLNDIDQIQNRFSAEYDRMPTSAKEKSKDNFAIKFIYNTQKIEGSTLKLKETADLLENGISPSAKPMQDIKEAEAHSKVFFEMLDFDKDLNMQILLQWHRELMRDTKVDIAGKIRDHDVGIALSKFKPPMYLELDVLLKEFSDWYNRAKKKIHPVELASLVHLKFVTIHPFSDGNGRMSRLMMNFVLKKHGFPMLDIPYTKRTSHYTALERSQVNSDENIFTQWFFRRYLAEHKKYLK